MSITLILDAGGGCEMCTAQVAFHLAAGVDEVVVRGSGPAADLAEALRPLVDAGVVSFVDRADPPPDAEWLPGARPGEFLWPRGGSLKDVLSLVSPRFGVVQVPVRRFLSQPTDGRHFAERTIARMAESATIETIARRPGAEPAGVSVDAVGRGRVLRGWYPIELLRFPDGEQTGHSAEDESLECASQHAEVVVDTRVRDALRSIADREPLLPGHTTFPASRVLERRRLTFPAGDVATDVELVRESQAAFAAEVPACLEDRSKELDRRVRVLEGGLRGALRRMSTQPGSSPDHAA